MLFLASSNPCSIVADESNISTSKPEPTLKILDFVIAFLLVAFGICLNLLVNYSTLTYYANLTILSENTALSLRKVDKKAENFHATLHRTKQAIGGVIRGDYS